MNKQTGINSTRASAGLPRSRTLATASALILFAGAAEICTAEELSALRAARVKERAFRTQIAEHLSNDQLKRNRLAADAAYAADPSPENFEKLRTTPVATDSQALAGIAQLRAKVKEQIRSVAAAIAPTVRAIFERAAQVVDRAILAAKKEEEEFAARYGMPWEPGQVVGGMQNLLRMIDLQIAGDDLKVHDLQMIVPDIFQGEPAPAPNESATTPRRKPAPKPKKSGKNSPPAAPSDFNNFVAENPAHHIASDKE
ncbi:MAG: hypothetical protein ACR2NX_00365 [Chthoniobacterales bacterium]